ncbi:MAG: YraN family protein [Candidatus Omnitrophota bacterium]
MANHKRLIGKAAEHLAVDFLKKNGYTVLTQNYATKFGELDIIARHGEYFCFVEVRSRSQLDFGFPQESLTAKKKQHLKLAALDFVKKKNLADAYLRFDMVCILFDKDQHVESITLEHDIIS